MKVNHSFKELKQEASFILENWLSNPCGGKRRKSVCDGECTDWKAPVREDGYFSACYMQERTRRLIKNLVKELEKIQ